MTWDAAVLKVVEAMAKESPVKRAVLLELMTRAGQITTETKGCMDCKPPTLEHQIAMEVTR